MEQNITGRNKLMKSENKTEHFKKETHLFLNDKYLDAISKLSGYDNLSVIYLHNNEISNISNLDNLRNLTSLHLQKNRITKIENLNSLQNLKRLFIGNNEISVVENLDELKQLRELHIEKQRLQKGESLCFNPKTIVNIADSLQILNVSNNNITTILYLEALRNLRLFNASHNRLSNIQDVIDTIRHWYHIETITLKENPIAKQYRYKDDIIANTFRLSTLDDKIISENTRCFIKRFKDHNNLMNKNSMAGINLSTSFKDLPNNYPPPLQKAASLSILRRSFHDFTVNPCVVPQNLNKHIPWKALPKNKLSRKGGRGGKQPKQVQESQSNTVTRISFPVQPHS